jgi:hypothetical protein
MRNTLNTILLSCLFGLSLSAMAESQSQDAKEINYLLEFVATSDCTFVRNGERYNGADAADHLRGKYNHDKRHVHTGEQFISRVASKSSLTGAQYTVKCEDSEPETTDKWLHRALAMHLNQSDPYRDR